MIEKAIIALEPKARFTVHNEMYDSIVWYSEEIPMPSEDAVNAKIVELENEIPFNQCKSQAKQLIAATDWAVLPDVGLQNKADFEAYRATLRALILKPVADPVFPTEPQPVWS